MCLSDNDIGLNIICRVPTETGKSENENGHGKVMEHAKLAKSHGILLSVMEFYQFRPRILSNLYVFCHH